MRKNLSGERLLKRKANHEFVERLADCATDINYFDDESEGLKKAIDFYVSTQVDAQCHCFVRVQEVGVLAEDEQLIARCFQVAFSQTPDEVDGYYLGSTAWMQVQ